MNRLRDFYEFVRQGDFLLLLLCCAASIYGIILISSASSYQGNLRYVAVQAAALVIGIILYFLFSRTDIEAATEKWKWMLIFNVVFIASLAVLGTDAGTGNKSWIRFNFLPIGIQPAEIVKITFILLLARQMSELQNEGISKTGSIARLLLHLGFMCGLIMGVSGDAGMVVVYVFIFFAMAFAAGVKLRWFLIGGGGVAGIFALLWSFTPLIKDYWKNRILIIFNHSLDPLGIGWQQERSVLAIGSGQLTGQGLFRGIQTQSTYESSLPARHTDFIFSAAGEELGMVGCILIILILSAIILRCIFVALNAPTPITSLTCIGFAGMLLCQTIMNIGMCLYLFPVVGLTLPFFSYGGSSLITLFAAMGMVSGVKMRSLPSWLRDHGEKNFLKKPKTNS